MNDKKTYGYPCTSAASSIIVSYIDLVLPITAPRLTQLREHLSSRFELVGSSSGPTSNQGGKIMLVVIWDTVSARMLPSLGVDVKPLVLSPSSLNKRSRGKNLLRNELPWFSSHTARSKSPRQGWTGEKPTHTNADSQGYAKNTGPPTSIIDFH